jgi:hypothetical protein
MTAAAELRVRLAPVRAAWLELEELAGELHDPQAIEHATIAALAMRHLDERAAELDDHDDDPAVNDVVAELERAVYGDEAAAA